MASDAPLPVTTLRERLDDAAVKPVSLLDGAALDALIDHARVLTDDYAPVDQLLAG